MPDESVTVDDIVMWFASSGRSSAKRPQFAPWPRCVRTGVVVGALHLLTGPASAARC